MIATDGTWSPAERPVQFLAGSLDNLEELVGVYPYVLVAVNEVAARDGTIKDVAASAIDAHLEAGSRVLIDSGVFWLTNEHKRAHGLTMDVALALPPEQIDGFEWLWNSYLEVHRRWGEHAWGFVELDQGGAVNKRLTRAKLNDLGIVPMPVYHPLNDGWEYLDEIAEGHDRLCFGNIVQAPRPVRLRLIHTLAERHRAWPDRWVHLLGYTASEWTAAFPIDSCDSSTWLSLRRFAQGRDTAMGRTCPRLPPGYSYRIGADRADPDGYLRASGLAACTTVMQLRGMRHYDARITQLLDLPAYPVHHPQETPHAPRA